jgi:CRISPR/Cas system CSM-associated protein Csm4 (group 5 of RAMP superfamily)
MIWLTAEQQGIGASRSQGFGRFEVTSWERLSGKTAA